MQMSVTKRLKALRARMAKEGIDAVFITTADHHASEYVASFFKVRAFFSGFTGSNGDLLVTASDARLWTDGRYFLQAEAELADSGITLMRSGEAGVAKIEEHLEQTLKEGDVLAFDGRCVTAAAGDRYRKIAQKKGADVRLDFDPTEDIWSDRPDLPVHDLYPVTLEYSGKSCAEKLSEVRDVLNEQGADALVLSKLDDIMWLTNLRGADVACNPVALSYLFMTPERTLLFVQEAEVTQTVRESMAEAGITLRDYHGFFSFLREIAGNDAIASEIRQGLFYDEKSLSASAYEALRQLSDQTGITLVQGKNPTTLIKAVKNETELQHTRKTYLMDSAILTSFLYDVKKRFGTEPMTEVSLAKQLDGMRAAADGFIVLSFPTISGFGPNAAIVHYEPTPETDAPVTGSGFYLVDSGATYQGGTTDVTRTLALGEITDEMKRHFTKTLVGMLRLADARFLKGCTGRNLDILARQALWEEHLDYKHGTGHGIGYMLNVHEGPQSIRWQFATGDLEEAVFAPGMLVSDEPGIYITGSHGVRIENILEVVRDTENDYGEFLKFAHLTYVPIDLDAVDVRYMEAKDIALLNAYHEEVYRRIAPLLPQEEMRVWLREATRKIG